MVTFTPCTFFAFRDQLFYAILPEERSLKASVALCEVMDGSLALPTSDGENSRLTQDVIPFSEVCVPTALWKIWLGTQTTEPGRWQQLVTGEPLNYQNFRPSSSYNNAVLGCAELRLDGLWEPDYCTAKRCTACSFDRSSFLRFRGLCFDMELEARFRVEGSPKGRPVFWSHQGLLIAWHSSLGRWQMNDPNTNTTLLWGLGVGSDYPLGRRRWRVATEICGHPEGHTLEATLSRCGPREFVCSTGECIAPHLRCNFHHDCPDRSDEVSCSVVQANRDALLQQVPPPPPLGSPKGDILQLEPSMTLTRVAAVDDLNMAITLEFQLTLTWNDPRVNFRHLGVAGRKGTMLTEEDAGQLWQPLLRVAGLDGNSLQELSRRFLAKAIAPPTQSTFNDVDTGKSTQSNQVCPCKLLADNISKRREDIFAVTLSLWSPFFLFFQTESTRAGTYVCTSRSGSWRGLPAIWSCSRTHSTSRSAQWRCSWRRSLAAGQRYGSLRQRK